MPLAVFLVLGFATLGRVLAPPPRPPATVYGSHIVANIAMPSLALGHPMPVTLYLPDRTAMAAGPLPVIILLHGVNGQGTDWVTRGHIQTTLDRLIAERRMPPVIVAMPSTGTSWYVDSADIGGPGNYETAVGSELPAWLAAHWNTRSDRDGKAIAGYSMGGFGALHIAFGHPENWAAAGSLSGTFLKVVGRQAAVPALNHRLIAGAFGTPFNRDRLVRASPVTLARALRPREHLAPAVFIGCGTHDQLHLTSETNDMIDELHQLGIPLATDVIDGGHDWKTWQDLLPDAPPLHRRTFRPEDAVGTNGGRVFDGRERRKSGEPRTARLGLTTARHSLNISARQRAAALAHGSGDLPVALGFFTLALAVRYASFHRSVIDWDESLYFLMAEAWRAGHLPYTTLCDNKPIGIYAIFAAFQSVFGDNVGSMRLAAVAAVSATAFCLYRLSLAVTSPDAAAGRSRLPAVVAGALYLLASTRDGGMAANTELFIAPLVCGGMLFAVSPRQGGNPAFWAGLSFGLAFIIKYVAVFEFAAPLLALTMLRPRQPGAPPHAAVIGFFAIGAMIPLAACLALYACAGRADIFVSASLVANFRRLDTPFSLDLARRAFHDHAVAFVLPYCAFALLLVPLVRSMAAVDGMGRRRDGVVAGVLLLWVAGALVGTASAKSFYPHYFLQPLPALCLTAVWVAGRALPFRGATGFAMTLALLVQPASGARDAIAETWDPIQLDRPGIGWLRDEPARIAADLRPALAGLRGTPLYVADYQPILYSLTSVPAPTRFAFPSFIIGRFLSRVVAVDPQAEFAEIAAKRPHFIVCDRNRRPSVERDNIEVYGALAALLDTQYRVWKIYPGAIVYRLRDDPGPGPPDR